MKPVHRSLFGAVVWCAFVAFTFAGLGDESWARALLVFAALVLVPLVLELIFEDDEPAALRALVRVAREAQFPAAILLAIGCLRPAGIAPAIAATPWLLFTIVLAVIGVRRAIAQGWGRPLGKLCADAALIFSAIGGAWTVADRAGCRPLNFDPAVVTLTAVHFHYAGLILPVLAGLLVRVFSHVRFATTAAVGVVLGVPAVALGITATQLGLSPEFEAAAGWWLALSGMAIGVLHVRLALENLGSRTARGWWGVSGASLFFAMLLAGIYAMRGFALPFPWLNLPWMRAVHGTVNAFGFALCGVLGWRAASRAN